PYFIYRVYGVGAFRLVADFVLITSFISLPFWIAQNLSSSVDITLVSIVHALHSQFPWDSWPRSMLIYTVGLDYSFMDEIGLYRFSSLFNEPGKFSFWINYAIIIYLLSGDRILSKRILFLIGMLITTFSTGGYLQFFMIALAYFLASSSYNIGVRYALLGIFLIFFITQYQRVSFLQPKVQEHIEIQQDVALEGAVTTGRFIRVRKGLEAIKNHPVIGRGISSATQVEGTTSTTYIGNVGGFIGFTARYGVPLSILFFVFFYRGFKYLTYINNRSTFLALGLWGSVMAAFIGQGTPLWNPIMLLFFIHGYLHYGIKLKKKTLSAWQN
ncbi:MAG: O-antigen ligase family protein, partial [bacterium]